MAVQASKSISLTDLNSGKAFYLSADQIISFTAITGSHTQLTYLDNRDNVIVRKVSEDVATVNTAAARTQAVTLNNAASTIIYIHSDKIIFLDDFTTYRGIIYNASASYPVTYHVTESAAAINTAAGNTFIITTQPVGSVASRSRWINNLYVAEVVGEAVGSLPSITFTTKVKIGTGVVVDNGTSGTMTAANITFTGGGATVQATGTVTVAGNLVTAITILTAGSGYTSYPTITITPTAGTPGTTPTSVVSMTVESPLTIASAGSNLNTAPILTFSATTQTLALATTTLSAASQTITGTTLTNAGAYKQGTDTYPTVAVSGGTGANILYDAQGTALVNIQVEETSATVFAAINAL